MKKLTHLVGVTIILIFLSSFGAAALEDFTLRWGDWNQFENTLDECESDNCITNDNIGEISGDFASAIVDTGETGFCGTAGLKQTFQVPDKENIGVGLAIEKAELDNWGGRVGLKANDEWIITFDSEGGESKIYDYNSSVLLEPNNTFYADISHYAGEEVTFKLATQDDSREWCNMGDHEQSINANAFLMLSDIQEGNFDSSQFWQKTQYNQVNCESQYSCNEEETQPLDTNKIENSQLIIDTGIDEADGGHCGTYGRNQWVYIPKADEVNLNFRASAELDEWGGELGIKLGNEWIYTFEDTDGEGKKSYEMMERTVDVSDYSGEYRELLIGYRDDSGEWCDMSDHDRRMVVESIGFETSGDTEGSSNQPPSVSLSHQRFAGQTVTFDASDTTDPDNPQGDLESRWDWNNDGNWDTDWLSVLQTSHTYDRGMDEATAKVQVRDGDGGTDSETESVALGGDEDDENTGGNDEISIPANGWNFIALNSPAEKSRFDSCSGARAYYAGDANGYLRNVDLTNSGVIQSGRYFVKSFSESDCSIDNVDLSTDVDSGTVTIPANGWKVINTGGNVNIEKEEFDDCGDNARAYYPGPANGFLRNVDLTGSGTLSSSYGPNRPDYFVKSSSDSSCTVNIPESEDSDGEGDNDDNDDEGSGTSYASDEDEWCQTNGHGEALSAFRDDVEAGCKPLNDLNYDRPSGGTSYYGAGNSDMTCSDQEGYICEN
jgi:hypothetical protein